MILSGVKDFPEFYEASIGSAGSGPQYFNAELPHEDKFWIRVHGTKKWHRNRAFWQIPVGASRNKERPKTRTYEVISGFYVISSLVLALVNSWLSDPSSLGGACFVDIENLRWFEF